MVADDDNGSSSAAAIDDFDDINMIEIKLKHRKLLQISSIFFLFISFTLILEPKKKNTQFSISSALERRSGALLWS